MVRFVLWMNEQEPQLVGRGLPVVRSCGGGTAETSELRSSPQSQSVSFWWYRGLQDDVSLYGVM